MEEGESGVSMPRLSTVQTERADERHGRTVRSLPSPSGGKVPDVVGQAADGVASQGEQGDAGDELHEGGRGSGGKHCGGKKKAPPESGRD